MCVCVCDSSKLILRSPVSVCVCVCMCDSSKLILRSPVSVCVCVCVCVTVASFRVVQYSTGIMCRVVTTPPGY